MKVLVVKIKTQTRFLVELHTDRLVDEVATLVAKKKYSHAIRTILSKGKLEKEIGKSETKKIKADLILTE